MKRAKAVFEKLTSLGADSRDGRNLRLRMSLLCRVHLDKTFVAGAQQTAAWQDLRALALAEGKEAPPAPEASAFQKVRSGDEDIMVYLPKEYADEAFALGSKYQRAELSAEKAIDAMQRLADHICYYELRLEQSFQALQFLREELAEAAELARQAAETALAEALGNDPSLPGDGAAEAG